MFDALSPLLCDARPGRRRDRSTASRWRVAPRPVGGCCPGLEDRTRCPGRVVERASDVFAPMSQRFLGRRTRGPVGHLGWYVATTLV